MYKPEIPQSSLILSQYVLEHSSSFVNEMHGSPCDGCAGCDTTMERGSDAEIADVVAEAPPIQVLLSS